MSKAIKVILIILVLVNLLFLGLGIYLKNFMFFTLSIVFLSTIAVIGIVIGGFAFLIYGLPSIHRNRDSLLSIIVYGIIYLKPPDIEKLKTEKNIKKLIRSLGYNRDASVQQAATNALVEMGEIVDHELKRAMNGSWLLPMRVSIGAAEVLLRIDFQRTLEHMGKCLKYPGERSAKISHETLTRIGEGAVEPLLRGYGGETSRYYPDTPDDLLIPVLLAIGEPAKEILFAIVKKREFSDYPPLYRDFLIHKHFIGLTEDGIRFERHLPGTWKQILRNLYFNSWVPDRIIGIGLLPFGNESFLDAGPVCFDTREEMPDGDCPVVFWDHEWIDTEKEIHPMFSSSKKMYECLLFAASEEINFFYEAIDESQSLKSTKQELLKQFLSIDQSGAGGPGKDYWTS